MTLFTEFKFDPAYVAEQTDQKRANLRANIGYSDFRNYAIGVIVQRLNRNRLRYRDYGPYWWAVKSILREAGIAVGNQTDPLIELEYCFDNQEQALVAADLFRDSYLKKYMLGSNQYILNSSNPEAYVLFDSDMEQQV